MKKYFIFAAVATAGLFASCSSSDDFANEGAQNPNVDERQEIRLNLATPGAMATRGTGTVGGVGTGTNVWRGQKINVFMFTKDDNHATTLDLTNVGTAAAPQYLYNNTSMITPGSDENLIDGMGVTANVASGQAMIEDGTINYYPSVGNFDFFGYHADDALTGALDDTDNAKWTVPFTIDGTQDLMSTKAALTPDQIAIPGVGATYEDYYSAKAARKGIDPTLTFKHLLTRLQFSVKAGNDNAAGYVAGTAATYKATDASGDYADEAAFDAETDLTKFVGGTLASAKGDAAALDAARVAANEGKYFFVTGDKAYKIEEDQAAVPAGQNVANAVKVKSIQVLSENTKGNLAVAWTAPSLTDDAKIAWDANQPDEADRWLTLMERPVLYDKNDGVTIKASDFEAYSAIDDAAYAALNETTTPKKSEVDAAIATATAHINAAVYATLSTQGQGKYTIVANTENEDLVALTATAPGIDDTKTDATRYPQKRVGESIILSPGAYTANADPTIAAAGSAQSLKMKVTVSQTVPTNWDPAVSAPTEKEQSYDLVINAPSGGFLQNTSYNVILTVYSLERIDVVAVITPWNDGGNISVGEDE